MQFLKNFFTDVGKYGELISEVVKDIATRGIDFRETSRQIIKVGRDSLPIVLLTAVFTGMVLALQTAYGLQRFGAKAYVGNVVGLALVREMGPVLTALMLCGRVGAGTAAEIGSMVVTEQVDALRTLGANPVRKLVSPRVLAGIICVPLLVAIADFFGIIGGQVIAVTELDQSAHAFQRGLYYTIVIKDVFDGAVKSSVFGFLLMSIACHRGLTTRGGTAGVGAATTAAVVTSSIVVFVSDFFITKFLLLI
jgi:phospholipid/cholesterol/gamma-HCH transport system permease protein